MESLLYLLVKSNINSTDDENNLCISFQIAAYLTILQVFLRKAGTAYSVSLNTGALSQAIDSTSVASSYSIGHTKKSN